MSLAALPDITVSISIICVSSLTGKLSRDATIFLGFNCSETIFQETYQEIFSSIPSICFYFNPFNPLKMIHVSSDHGINSPAQGNSGGEAVSVIDGHSPLEQIS